MLCPRPSTFLRQNLHIQKKKKKSANCGSTNCSGNFDPLSCLSCKVMFWTLQPWSAAASASPKPFIGPWRPMWSASPIPVVPGDESRGGLSPEQDKSETQPPRARTGCSLSAGTVALPSPPLAMAQKQRQAEGCWCVRVSWWAGPGFCSTLYLPSFSSYHSCWGLLCSPKA